MARKRSTNTATAAAVGAADPNAPAVEPQAAPEKRSGPTIEDKGKFFKRCYSAFLDIEGAKKEMQSANGFYRNELKEAAKAGVSKKAIIDAIKLMSQQPEDIARDFSDLNEMMVIAKIPVGPKPVQLGLFKDGESVATKIENDSLQATKDAEFNEESAEELGYRAGLEGKAIDKNPHLDKDDGTDGSPESLRWIAGWKRGQAENLAAFKANGSGKQAAAAAH
jgi:ribosome modulation factor